MKDSLRVRNSKPMPGIFHSLYIKIIFRELKMKRYNSSCRNEFQRVKLCQKIFKISFTLQKSTWEAVWLESNAGRSSFPFPPFDELSFATSANRSEMIIISILNVDPGNQFRGWLVSIVLLQLLIKLLSQEIVTWIGTELSTGLTCIASWPEAIWGTPNSEEDLGWLFSCPGADPVPPIAGWSIFWIEAADGASNDVRDPETFSKTCKSPTTDSAFTKASPDGVSEATLLDAMCWPRQKLCSFKLSKLTSKASSLEFHSDSSNRLSQNRRFFYFGRSKLGFLERLNEQLFTFH